MPSSNQVSLETVNGIVRKVEGKVVAESGPDGEAYYNFIGLRITVAVGICEEEGFEHVDTDIFFDRKIFRLKLKKKKIAP